MSDGVACSRLAEERKAWRKSHPHGFVAKPGTASDGSVNLMVWHCIIPGRKGIKSDLVQRDDYPSKPPQCNFPKGFFHPNVYSTGQVCLSILNEHGGWRPSITVKQILVSIQDLLDKPNPRSAAQSEAGQLYDKNLDEYRKRVRQQALAYPNSL